MFPRLNTMLDDVGLCLSLLTLFVQHRATSFEQVQFVNLCGKLILFFLLVVPILHARCKKYKICKLHCLSHFRTWENLYLFLASGVNFPCVIRQCTKSAKLRAYSFCIYHISQPSFAVLLTLGYSPMLW